MDLRVVRFDMGLDRVPVFVAPLVVDYSAEVDGTLRPGQRGSAGFWLRE